ncbi:MAG TPA: hypothetical protein VFN72_02765 [Solirubrobacterales bacterium]|nr:hypothetical protein [Solirubrobacterales bacterium]
MADPEPVAEARLGRPAFYALRPGGWRDLVTVLHPPYTAWNLANVAFGAAAASQIHTDRFVSTLAAFFLAVGVGAHTLDELNGRPLKTQLSDRTLIALAIGSLAGAVGIGIAGCIVVSATLIPFVLAGAFIVVAYNLELFGGRFHTDFWLAAAWGAFPALTSWWVNTLSFGSAKTVIAGALVAVGCFGLTMVQRRLSTPVRRLRRKTVSVSGEQRLDDGTVIPLTASELAGPLDRSLRTLSWAVVILSTGLVVVRY